MGSRHRSGAPVRRGAPRSSGPPRLRARRDQTQGDTVHWVARLLGDSRPVGTCGFYRGFADGEGEIGYVLLPAHRGRGLMGEAVAAAVAFGFASLGLRAVVARVNRRGP
ncbi:MAG: GNAT family N-acetyltransferase [Trueperaceae bacterium]